MKMSLPTASRSMGQKGGFTLDMSHDPMILLNFTQHYAHLRHEVVQIVNEI